MKRLLELLGLIRPPLEVPKKALPRIIFCTRPIAEPSYGGFANPDNIDGRG